MEVQLKLWKSNKFATLPTCNSVLQVPFLFWLLEGAGAKISNYWFSSTCDAMVSIFLALGFGRALLFHYCTHEGRSQHSVADMRVHCSILVTTCPWKICPYNANMQRPFFLQTYLFLLRAVRTASESTEKCVQSTEISVQFGPVRTKRTFFSKNAPFFSRPSVHPSKLFQQLAPQDQGEWMCSNPVYVPHKCRNVQMSAPAAHYKKQAKVLYFDTTCGSKAVQP